jgi:hypothetical protein
MGQANLAGDSYSHQTDIATSEFHVRQIPGVADSVENGIVSVDVYRQANGLKSCDIS